MKMIEILPMISTSFIALSAILVAIGWRLIIKGNREQHRKVMLAGAGAALVFFILYLTKTIFFGSTKFDGPEEYKVVYLIFLLFRIVLAMVAAVFGIVTLTYAFKQNFRKHRKIGRVTAVVWLITAITGITVYILLYLLYPGEVTRSMFKAIFHY